VKTTYRERSRDALHDDISKQVFPAS